MADSSNALEKLESALRRARPEVAAKLRPPAAKGALSKLPKAAPELRAWFAWHDGQTGTASLSPEDNRYLLSIDDARDVAKFLADEGKGWKKSWFPLFANGAGDYVVYETAKGKTQGALVEYRHDDDARPVVHASLSAWIASTTKALAALPAAAATTAAAAPGSEGAIRISAGAEWSKARPPSKDAFAAAPVGTAYKCEHVPMVVRAQPQVHVYVKLAPNRWAHTAVAVDADAIGELARRMAAGHDPPRHWLKDDASMPKALKNSLSRWTGKELVPHDELFTTRATVG